MTEYFVQIGGRNIRVYPYGSAFVFYPVDGQSKAMTTIDYEHHEIHGGSHFYIAGYDTFAADGDIDFQITTPDTLEYTHMAFEIQSTGAVVFSVYEGATVAAGSALTPWNSNRNSSHASSLTVQYDGSVSAAGTLIYTQAFGVAGNPSQRAGGTDRSASEIILKRDTTYRFFIESNSADNVISYHGYWYEHTHPS